jgi:hypothetical protein
MAIFWRCVHFIGECFVKASDAQITWADRFTFWFPGALAACVAYVFYRLFGSDGIVVPVSLWLFFLICHAFWNAFKRCDSVEIELKKIKAERIEFDVRVLQGEPSDAFFSLGAVRIAVFNKHTTKIARGVQVKLRALECSNWNDRERARCLRFLNVPYSLPKKNNNQAIAAGYDIDPKSEEVFDFFGKGFRTDERLQNLCMAPFSLRHNNVAIGSMLGDFLINSEDDPDARILQAVVTVVCDGTEKKEIPLHLPFLKYGSHLVSASALEVATPPSAIPTP